MMSLVVELKQWRAAATGGLEWRSTRVTELLSDNPTKAHRGIQRFKSSPKQATAGRCDGGGNKWSGLPAIYPLPHSASPALMANCRRLAYPPSAWHLKAPLSFIHPIDPVTIFQPWPVGPCSPSGHPGVSVWWSATQYPLHDPPQGMDSRKNSSPTFPRPANKSAA